MNLVSTLAANGNGENTPAVSGIDLAKNVFTLRAVNRHRLSANYIPQEHLAHSDLYVAATYNRCV